MLLGTHFTITIYAFLRWYYEPFLITPRMISHYEGVILKKSQNVPLRETISVSLSSGLLGKLFHYGSIHRQNTSGTTTLLLLDISYPKKYLDIITEFLEVRQVSNHAMRAANLLLQEEHEQLEFKSSLSGLTTVSAM